MKRVAEINITSAVSSTRKIANLLSCVMVVALAFLAVTPLFFVFYYVIKNGASYISWEFITHLPTPVGEPGSGMANALWGSVQMVGAAAMVILPMGLLGGVYLSEYSHSRLGVVMKFTIDLLSSVPSIVAGLFIYGVVVIKMGGFSGWAGAAALGVLMFPVMVKTTTEVLKLTPQHIREAGLAL